MNIQTIHPFTGQVLQPVNELGEDWARDYNRLQSRIKKVWIVFSLVCACAFGAGVGGYVRPTEAAFGVNLVFAVCSVPLGCWICLFAKQIEDTVGLFDMSHFRVVEGVRA